MQGFLIIGIVFALLIAIFSIQNAVPVSLSFFSWQFNTSLVVVILGAVALGALVMGIFGSIKQFRLKRKMNRLTSKNKELEKANRDLADQLARIHEKNKEEAGVSINNDHETKEENER